MAKLINVIIKIISVCVCIIIYQLKHVIPTVQTYKISLLYAGAQRTVGSTLPCPGCHGLKNYIMAYKRLSTSLGSKMLNSLGSGGNQNLRPSCRRPPTRTFHPPVGTLRLDAPALVRVCSPDDGSPNGLIIPLSTLPVLRVLFRCNLFDVSSVFWLFFQANLILIIILIDPV